MKQRGTLLGTTDESNSPTPVSDTATAEMNIIGKKGRQKPLWETTNKKRRADPDKILDPSHPSSIPERGCMCRGATIFTDEVIQQYDIVDLLEVLVKGEVSAALALILRGRVICRSRLLGTCHDASLLVVRNTLLEKVGLSAQRDVFHEVEGVGGLVHLLVAEGDQQSVGHKLNVLLHQCRVHAEKSARQCLGKELLLNGDGISYDALHALLAGSVLEVRE